MNGARRSQLKRACVFCMVLAMAVSLAGADEHGYTNGNSNGDGKQWWEKTDVSFDLILRQQAFNSEYVGSGSSVNYPALGTSQKSEYQARVNFNSQIKDNVSANIQIASGYGSSPRTSFFQHMDDKFSGKDVWLRQAYLNWQPTQCPGSNVFAGKVPNIFKRAGGNQVIWDKDVTMEGAAANYVKSINDSTTFNANLGAFWVEEAWGPASGTAGDVVLYAAQAYLARQCDELSRCLFGVSFYSYSNIINQTGFASGNSETSSMLANDFDLLEVFGQYNREINGKPVMLFGTYINNTGTEAGFNGDTAWSIGGSIDPCPRWRLGYDYRDIEEDSILGIFTDNYFVHGGVGAGGMGSNGHNFTGSYKCAKNIKIACRLILSEIEGSSSDSDFNLFQVDLKVKTP